MLQNTESSPASPSPGHMLTCARMRQWAETAQPNARLVYGHGVRWQSCCRTELLEQVVRLQDKGLVTSHFVRGRDGEPDQHLLQRTKRPYLKGMEL